LAADPPVAAPLPPGQFLLGLLLVWRAQGRPLVAGVPVRLDPRRHYRPAPVVHLLVMRLPRSRRRDRRDPQPPLLPPLGLLAPARPLALAHHDELVLQRVPLLLARVIAPLPLLGPVLRPLAGVEKSFLDLILLQFDPAFGDAEDAGEQRLEDAEVAADG